MGFSRFLGVEEDFAFVNKWLTQTSFKIVFENVIMYHSLQRNGLVASEDGNLSNLIFKSSNAQGEGGGVKFRIDRGISSNYKPRRKF